MATSTKDAVTKAVAAEIGAELRAFAEKLFAKHGLQMTSTKSTYGDSFKFTVQADGIELSDDGINLASTEAQFYEKCGLSEFNNTTGKWEVLNAPLGTKFTLKGEQYIFAGVSPRKKKFPILAVSVKDNREYGFSSALIAELNRQAGA